MNSTALSTAIDPEDFRDVIAVYQRCVTDAMAKFGGFVARYLGDGALTYFGYPTAAEDDAERAVRAGMAVVDEVSKLPLHLGHTPQVRVGIATGLVIVGDIVGDPDRPELDVAGETPNLAARLLGIAEPGWVVVSSSTRRLAGGLFEYQDLGAVSLKGFPQPMEASRVLRAGHAESRFDARHQLSSAKFAGREVEIRTLARCWDQAAAGRGEVVLVAGEAGIGKSRLVAEFQKRIGDDHLRLGYFCWPHSTSSALFPVIKQIERVAQFERTDSLEQKHEKLKALLRQTVETPLERALIGDLLSLQAPDRHLLSALAPQRRKHLTLTTLAKQIAELVSERPLLLLVEDIHWIDPTSLELLDLIIEQASRQRILLVITSRLESLPPALVGRIGTRLTLARLPQEDAAAMVDEIAGSRQLPPVVKSGILARADGIPLFVEELTKAVLESGSLDVAGLATRSPSGLSIPATLHDSLMARLDRLGHVRELAQTASVIGREFSYELLAAIADLPAQTLDAELETLERSQVVSSRGDAPHAVYQFRHALVRDAAYQSLLRRPRQELHARIVQGLEQRFPDVVRSQPDLVAQHCTMAGLTGQAISYWLKAGQQSQRRYAMLEANAALQKGLELARTLPETAERSQTELELLIALSRTVIATDGYGAPEAARVFAEARGLCDKIGQPPELIPVLYGQWAHALIRADVYRASEVAKELLDLGEARHDPVWTARGCRLEGLTCLAQGRFPDARQFLTRGLELYDSTVIGRDAAFTLYDPKILMQAYLSFVLIELGYPDQARQQQDALLAEGRASKQPFTLPYVLTLLGISHLSLEAFGDAKEVADELVAHAEEHAVAFFWGIGKIFRGRSLVTQGRATEGLRELNEGLDAYRKTDGSLWLPYLLYVAGDAHGQAGETGEGLRYLGEALGLVRRAGEHFAESNVHRARGELLAKAGNLDEAQESLRQALAMAQQQGARLSELRAAVSLAHVLRDLGVPYAESGILDTALHWFSGKLDTPAYRHAQALLTSAHTDRVPSA